MGRTCCRSCPTSATGHLSCRQAPAGTFTFLPRHFTAASIPRQFATQAIQEYDDCSVRAKWASLGRCGTGRSSDGVPCRPGHRSAQGEPSEGGVRWRRVDADFGQACDNIVESTILCLVRPHSHCCVFCCRPQLTLSQSDPWFTVRPPKAKAENSHPKAPQTARSEDLPGRHIHQPRVCCRTDRLLELDKRQGDKYSAGGWSLYDGLQPVPSSEAENDGMDGPGQIYPTSKL